MDTLVAASPADPVSATLFIALELSRSTWLVALHSPGAADKVSQHRLEGGDAEGLLALIERRRDQAHRDGADAPHHAGCVGPQAGRGAVALRDARHRAGGRRAEGLKRSAATIRAGQRGSPVADAG